MSEAKEKWRLMYKEAREDLQYALAAKESFDVVWFVNGQYIHFTDLDDEVYMQRENYPTGNAFRHMFFHLLDAQRRANAREREVLRRIKTYRKAAQQHGFKLP